MHYVRVKATPGAKREHIEVLGEHAFSIFVREPPSGGLANRRISQIVATLYDVEVRRVSLKTGHLGRNKLFAIN